MAAMPFLAEAIFFTKISSLKKSRKFVCVCVLFIHSVTAGANRTKPGAGPPHVPGRVLGFPDPGNILSRFYTSSLFGLMVMFGPSVFHFFWPFS